MSAFSYIKSLVSDRQIGSVTPSSRFTVGRILRKIPFDRDLLIVEYGPGLGVISKELLHRLSPRSRLMMFETNDDFVEKLRETFVDKRVSIEHRSASDVLEVVGEGKADYIISGIPFSMIEPTIKDGILENTALALRPCGRFITYQVFPPPAKWDNFLKKPMERWFNVDKVEYELLNIPPMRIYTSSLLSASSMLAANDSP